MKKNYLIPFDPEDGSLLSWALEGSPNVLWRDNHEFEDTLVYDGYAGGRSAMTMNMVSKTTGATYPMFFTFFDAILQGMLEPSVGPGRPLEVKGRWTFCKRGMNYSVCPAGEGK